MMLKNLEKEGSTLKVTNLDSKKDTPAKQPKSILKNIQSQDPVKKNTPSVSSNTYSASESSSDSETENKNSEEEVKSRPSLINARKKSVAPSILTKNPPLIEIKASNKRRMSKMVSNDNYYLNDRSLIDMKGKQSEMLQGGHKMHSQNNLSKYDLQLNPQSKSSKFKPSHLSNTHLSNEAHIEKYIKSISPFKDIIKLDREHSQFLGPSTGINSFLPSLNEHKVAILTGNSKQKKPSFRQPRDQSSKQIKRSLTLLGNIKEVPEKKQGGDVGVVPKDLGFDFIKDLIDVTDNEDDNKKEEKKNRSNMQKMKSKKSMYNLY